MCQLHLSHRSIPSVANHVLSEVGREYSTYQPLTPCIRYSRHRAARSRQNQVAAIEWIQRITNWSPTESSGPRIPKSSKGIKPRRILAPLVIEFINNIDLVRPVRGGDLRSTLKRSIGLEFDPPHSGGPWSSYTWKYNHRPHREYSYERVLELLQYWTRA